MGRKDKQQPDEPLIAKEPEADKPPQDAQEDLPIVKELKEIDDKYLEMEREYEKKVQELQKKFCLKQAPLLAERAKVLAECEAGAEDVKSGTPALVGFWLQALKHHPAFEDVIEDYDEPVLEHLKDITRSLVNEDKPTAGFKLTFIFAENSYFEGTELWKEYHLDDPDPYTSEITVQKITASTIAWKAGKDVTVEKVSKKVKGGGAKKAKQKKEKEEPRNSFFRTMFRNMEAGGQVPDDVDLEKEQIDEEDDDEDVLEFLMESDYEIGCALRGQIIPYAVRWYTGEASPDDDDDDEEDEEEDDEDEESEEEDDEDDTPPAKGKAKSAAAKKKAGGGAGAGQSQQQQECKQQ